MKPLPGEIALHHLAHGGIVVDDQDAQTAQRRAVHEVHDRSRVRRVGTALGERQLDDEHAAAADPRAIGAHHPAVQLDHDPRAVCAHRTRDAALEEAGARDDRAHLARTAQEALQEGEPVVGLRLQAGQ